MGEAIYFPYGDRETDFLRARDARLAEAIDKIGHIDRALDTDLFSAVVHHIIGQQVSTKAQATIWERLRSALGEVSAGTVIEAGEDSLRACGMNGRKASYITDFSQKVLSGCFDLEALRGMTDGEAVAQLSSLRGVGVWTAEMILLFCMARPDVFSFDDLAVRRGLRMLYRHREIDRRRLETYRRRFSPYCSTASLYLWAVSSGAIEGLSDPGIKKR